jgi:hypothetical protein
LSPAGFSGSTTSVCCASAIVGAITAAVANPAAAATFIKLRRSELTSIPFPSPSLNLAMVDLLYSHFRHLKTSCFDLKPVMLSITQ